MKRKFGKNLLKLILHQSITIISLRSTGQTSRSLRFSNVHNEWIVFDFLQKKDNFGFDIENLNFNDLKRPLRYYKNINKTNSLLDAITSNNDSDWTAIKKKTIK